jgi:hypothetical protein
VISIISLILTVLIGGVAVVVGLFSLAFLDHCPRESCSIDGVTVVMTAPLAAGLVGLAGLIATVVQLARRKSARPFAIARLVACLLS